MAFAFCLRGPQAQSITEGSTVDDGRLLRHVRHGAQEQDLEKTHCRRTSVPLCLGSADAIASRSSNALCLSELLTVQPPLKINKIAVSRS